MSVDEAVERLWTIPEVAEFLHISQAGLRRIIGRGELASNRIGRQIRIPRSAIIDYMKETANPALQCLNEGDAAIYENMVPLQPPYSGGKLP